MCMFNVIIDVQCNSVVGSSAVRNIHVRVPVVKFQININLVLKKYNVPF